MIDNRTEPRRAPAERDLYALGHVVSSGPAPQMGRRGHRRAPAQFQSSTRQLTFSIDASGIHAAPLTSRRANPARLRPRRSTTSRRPTATGWPGTVAVSRSHYWLRFNPAAKPASPLTAYFTYRGRSPAFSPSERRKALETWAARAFPCCQ